MNAGFAVGMYLLVGCAIASCAWVLWAHKESGDKFTPTMHAMIFVIYSLLWPIALWFDRRKFLRNLFGIR